MAEAVIDTLWYTATAMTEWHKEISRLVSWSMRWKENFSYRLLNGPIPKRVWRKS
jgi:hypothetical protein